MRSRCRHRRHAERSWAQVALAAAFVLGACAASAQDERQEFAAWHDRNVAWPQRDPADAMLWERLVRPADRFAPPLPDAAARAWTDDAARRRWRQVLDAVQRREVPLRSADTSAPTVLALAAADGAAEVVREMLARGAEPDRIGDAGFTPLGAAAFNGQIAIIRMLARAGADLHRWGSTGQTPLHLAAMTGRVAAAQQLLALGADKERLNRQRETALDVAAANARLEVVDRLIAAGADAARAGRR